MCTEVQKLYYTAEENNVSLNVEKKKITVHLIKDKVLIMSPGIDVTAGPVDILGPLRPATFVSSVSFNID